MAKVDLLGGAYTARSLIADAQRCVNLYPEKNAEGSAAPFTHHLTPGLVTVATAPTLAPCRGLYFTTQGELYGVYGSYFYHISDTWVFTQLTVLTSRLHPVSMRDNGIELMLVDGTPKGYVVNLATRVLTEISNPAFYGADRVDVLDNFFILNKPNSPIFYISENLTSSFNALDFASKTGRADPLQAAIVIHRELWLIGTQTTEIWYNSGAAAFPFERISGAFISSGAIARYSIAKIGIAVFFLSQDEEGRAIVARGRAYTIERVSTRAIEAELASYTKVDDAIGMTYQILGHNFYKLSFPVAQKTWVYDETEGLWHEELWIDENGDEFRDRANAVVNAFGKHYVGDRQNGKIYRLDEKSFTHDGSPIVRIRSMPHLVADGKRITYPRFVANMDTGNNLSTDTSLLTLRWSDTRGHSWGEGLTQSLGLTGEYGVTPAWHRLGEARDRVFELRWSGDLFTALNGAFIDGLPEPPKLTGGASA
jgi:hypothetical protein